MEENKIIPELHEAEEPILTREEKIAELKKIEEEEEKEDAKADDLELEDGVEAMTDEELQQFTKQEKSKETPKKVIATTPKPKPKPKPKTPINKNIINKEKTMLYYYPTPTEWEEIHKLKPARIIFYFTMTKHEYKELFLCQVKYQTKIIGSTGARVI